ncbi:MAG: galactonate dehydratase [Micrococcales bacterium 73-15]|uniref:UxaA family hydrolase n=1 Tax=Salana multivorans TaxID=120377 RepID=UPI00095E708F|nr:altronate dehydratase family protein [Salana multivorans]OJX96116.1 MAG: galactonate dehydratase [Micrococcales bacterium 73-15]
MSDVILLAPHDDVAVATRDLVPGESITTGDGESDANPTVVVVRDRVPRGHKVALRDLPLGSEVRKYGQVIGRTTRPVPAGSQVHVHNLEMPRMPGASDASDAASDYAYATEHRELPVPDGERPTFLGYRRADGRVGTRNYVAIVTSVNCSASTARFVADQFRGRALAQFPHVDGVVALTHGSGCGLVPTSEGGRTLLRTLRGYAAHPNVGGVLVLGLGCEMLQVDALVAEAGIPADTLVRRLVIQETGGIRATVRAAVAEIEAMLPELDARRREVCDVSDLVLGLNCGGSDGYSGITANPALGVASDLLVAYGARSVLAETPEVYGAEHLLTRRAVSPEVGRRLIDRIAWWREYAAAGGGTLDNNPSPGNKAGGLTTILEKSLGAVAKAGSADLAAVYQYAEPIDTPGLGFMDTPGYDPVSVTGLVAGGATVVVFTTGRGSVLGCKPSPSIKVATNTAMYLRMHEDMDLNAGRIVDGTASLAEVGREIFDLVLAVASGRKTVSEELDLGQDEFQPWLLGTVT